MPRQFTLKDNQIAILVTLQDEDSNRGDVWGRVSLIHGKVGLIRYVSMYPRLDGTDKKAAIKERYERRIGYKSNVSAMRGAIKLLSNAIAGMWSSWVQNTYHKELQMVEDVLKNDE